MGLSLRLRLNRAFYQENAKTMSAQELKQQMRLEAEDGLDEVNWEKMVQRATKSRTGAVRRKRKAKRQRRA